MRKSKQGLNSREAILKRKIKGIRHGRHCVFAMHVHLVFVTKYRRVCFTKRILEPLKDTFKSVCEDLGAELIEFEGGGDHVHLLVNYPTPLSISKLVNSLKGVSSRMIRKDNFPEIKNKIWGNSLWSPSYFASSCGGAPLYIIQEYIQNQESPEE